MESYPNALHTAPRRRGRRSSNNANARTTPPSTTASACAAMGMCVGALGWRMSALFALPDSGVLSRTLSGCARTMPFLSRDHSAPKTARCVLQAGSRMARSRAAAAGLAMSALQPPRRLYVSLVPTLPPSLLPAWFALPILFQRATLLLSVPSAGIIRHQLPVRRVRHSACAATGSTRAG